MDDFNKRMNEVMSDPVMLDRANGCKDGDELYALCEGFFPGVSKDEFIRSLAALQESQVLGESELESVAGGNALKLKLVLEIGSDR